MPSWPLVACLLALVARPSAVRIALVSDLHVSRAPSAVPYLDRARATVAAVNAARVDAVVVAGDLTEAGTREQLDDARALLQGFEAPVVAVAGNHDVGGKRAPGKSDGVSAAAVSRYENVMGRSYSFLRVRWLRVVAVNAPLMGSGLEGEEAQWRFLEAVLPGPIPTVVVSHFPAFVVRPLEGPDPYWNIDPAPRGRLMEMMGRGDVRAFLAGHLHYGLRHDDGGTAHIVTPPVSFGLPQGKQPEGWTLVTVPRSGRVTAEFRVVGRAP